MKKGIIVCYFGEFPNYFQLWLDSCGWNPSWNFLIFTDNRHLQETYKTASNICFIEISFEKFKKYVQSKFDFKISLSCPYKWCDYRPAVGYVFQEYLKEYEYFGFCDMDVIWGNLSKFYPDELIEKYEKFLVYGHIQLYRNNEKMRTLFMNKIYSKVSYKNVFSSKYNYGFDEIGSISINKIANGGGVKQYRDTTDIGDIYPYGNQFLWIKREENPRNSELVPIDYIKVSGPYVILSKNREERECAYIHLQKRKMSLDMCENKEYYIRHNLISSDINGIWHTKPKHVVRKPSGYKITCNRVRRAVDLIRYSF